MAYISVIYMTGEWLPSVLEILTAIHKNSDLGNISK